MNITLFISKAIGYFGLIMTNFKKYLPIYVIITAAVIFTFVANLGPTQRTVPKIKLSYFTDFNEFSKAITQRLNLEIKQQKHFLIGVEPEKENHLELIKNFKIEIEKMIGLFDEVYVDSELKLSDELKQYFGAKGTLAIKSDWVQVGKILTEQKNKKVLIITASIYSTNLVQQNSYNKIKTQFQINPITFSMAYFPVTSEDEKNSLFPCMAEDNSGSKDWGCASTNKARSVRRKINIEKIHSTPHLTAGLMDLTGENNYMILIGQ